MKVDMTKELSNRDSLLGYLILHGLTYALDKTLVNRIANASTTDGYVEVTMMVNGEEINLESCIEHWQSQVDRIITKEAKLLVDERFSDLSDLFYDLETRLRSEVDKRLEDWEKE